LRQAQAGCDNAAAEPMKQPADLQPPHSTLSRDQAAEHMYYIDGSRRCQPCPASPPLPIPIQPSQNPGQKHPHRP
ncbi:MAG: hypothetical protein ACK46L_14370, partial [Synechococcaceae cyanobacterium]